MTWAQLKNGNSKGDFDGNRSPQRDRLRGEGASRPADEDIGRNASSDHPQVARSANIFSSEGACRCVSCWREHSPFEYATRRGADDVEPHHIDGSFIGLRMV